MLDIVRGQTKNNVVAKQLAEKVSQMGLTGTLYLGYPILATADEKIEVDALLVSREHGLAAFLFGDYCPKSDDLGGWAALRDDQDRLYFAIKNTLSRHKDLRVGRSLAIEIYAVTVFPVSAEAPKEFEGISCDFDHLTETLSGLPGLSEEIYRPLQAALQRVSTIKPAKRRANVKRDGSRGAVLRRIEQEIANLDQWQKRAAIESPEGPQRIRGLAGSGKTVVLALKAAYLHAQHPDWTITVTFHSRSLYQQFTDLIRRFSFEHLNDEPNWINLRVLHAWGSSDREGVYAQMATHVTVDPKDFLYAKSRYGRSEAFGGVCSELLAVVEASEIEPLYDAILIDEAQDLPPSFFQLAYHFTRPPRRIIWAYDELQRLSETSMPSIDELFGRDKQGNPRIQLENAEEQPRQDIILPVCYRNTPWALTLAHALGFGIYREKYLVQHFDEPELWQEIGYEVVSGELRPGKQVVLRRSSSSYPTYFKRLLDPDDAVVAMSFPGELEQVEWVANSIQRNLKEDEIDPDDILIILPDAYTARRQGTAIIESLARRGISGHLAGVTTSRDEIFQKQSVAIAHIHRSKGNEAPMVYVLDCQRCFSGLELITLRNILFTAITRCRAWVRVCGWGVEMDSLKEEMDKVHQKGYQLEFRLPTEEELRRIRMIHRERTADEKAKVKKAQEGLREFLRALQRGDIALENLPLDLRTALASLQREQEASDDGAE